MQIAEAKRRFEETQRAVPAMEVECDVVVGVAAGAGEDVAAGGLADGVASEGGFGGIDVLGESAGAGEGVAMAVEALSSLAVSPAKDASGVLEAAIGGGPASPAPPTEEEYIEKEAQPDQPALSKTNNKKRGRPRKSVMVAKHLFVKRLTEDQEVDL